MKISDLNTIGLNMMYKSTQTTIADTMAPANFANNNTNEAFIQEKCPSWNSYDGTRQLFGIEK